MKDVIHPEDEKKLYLLQHRFYWCVGLLIFGWVSGWGFVSGMFIYHEDRELDKYRIGAPFVAKELAAEIREKQSRAKAYGP